jgi:hypothetical protein
MPAEGRYFDVVKRVQGEERQELRPVDGEQRQEERAKSREA